MGKGELAELREMRRQMEQGFQLLPLLEKLGKFIVDCSEGSGPVMTSMIVDFGDGDNRTLLKLWASTAMNSPMDRIRELRERVDELEKQLLNNPQPRPPRGD